MALNGSDLYIAQTYGTNDKITKVDLSSLSVKDISVQGVVKAYPNPAQHTVFIDYPSEKAGNLYSVRRLRKRA